MSFYLSLAIISLINAIFAMKPMKQVLKVLKCFYIVGTSFIGPQRIYDARNTISDAFIAMMTFQLPFAAEYVQNST